MHRKRRQKALFMPLTRRRLFTLMKIHGVQTDLLDRGRLIFPWDGLEYQFYLEKNQLRLERVLIQMDIHLGPVKPGIHMA